ncbi:MULTISPECIES: TenA family protein [unclassified Luteococcus]|uniref:TenA family protein n=1 Tax=unclassified Luteococcus TaxID=2639923 RepID=UPI00313E5679
MGFTDELWEQACPILTAIERHPFVTGLGDGSLPHDIFEGYLTQDALYLADYARAMGMLAGRASHADEITFWGIGVQGAIVAERELHAAHVEVGAGVMSPTCRAYTSYLLATAAAAPYEVGVAAILPCFWIYQWVGEKLLESAGDLSGHPYGDWIGMYGDPAFAESTARAREITDRLADAASDEVRERMREAFLQASRYEWMFWDAAWRQEAWPV